MIDVNRLRLLLELSRRGTITAVAHSFAYTPSAVSQQLAALEREVGVPLLERAGRRVALTPAGVTLARYAESVLAVLQEAEAALAATRGSLAGPLRIGAFPTAARTLLPPVLVTLGRDHPRLELMVTELDPADVPDALRSGALDVAITSDYDYVPAESEPAIETKPLLQETVYLATAATGGGNPVPTIHDCRDAPWIAGSPGSVCHALVVRACRAAGFTPRIRHVADDFATVLVLVGAGQGVSLIPQLGLPVAHVGLGMPDTPASVTLTPLDTRRRTSVAYRRGMVGHPAVAAFAAAIGESADHYRTSLDAALPDS